VSVLRNIERKIGGLVEGVFSRTFRSGVQPVELARKLAKEMDDHRTISIHRVYVPNEYTVYLAPPDREQFAGYEPQLRDELAEYLVEHARREGYTLATRPLVVLETEPELSVGEFGIAVAASDAPAEEPEPAAAPAVPVVPPPAPAAAAAIPAPEGTMVYAPPAAEPAPPPPVRRAAVLRWDGGVFQLGDAGATIGRSSDCDLVLADANVSRRHAEVRAGADGFTLVDLGSTNGSEVNGRRVREATLAAGDVIVLGTTRIRFEEPGG
jgi:hypothetical protein